MNPEPLARFHEWLEEARAAGAPEPEAMALATVDAIGAPAVRMVLLKQADADGFVFYTNLRSPKALALRVHGRAELCFHWRPPGRQVRVHGVVGPVGEEEADAYFQSRPYLSRIGAWASEQSQPGGGSLELSRRVARFCLLHPGGRVPRPPHWSGFRLEPEWIEFWQERPHRLHDRVRYHRAPNGTWAGGNLFP